MIDFVYQYLIVYLIMKEITDFNDMLKASKYIVEKNIEQQMHVPRAFIKRTNGSHMQTFKSRTICV